MQDLTQHPKWVQSNKLYYGKYECAITIGPYTQYNYVNLQHYIIPNRKASDDISHRTRRLMNLNFSHTQQSDDIKFHYMLTVYTSHRGFVDWIVYQSGYPIASVVSPANADHAKIMHSLDEKSEFRKRLYHGKYKFRVNATRPWRSNTTDEEMIAAYDWAMDQFDTTDNKILRRAGGYYNYRYTGRRMTTIPYIYTNNEAAIMLFKMAFSNTLSIKVTRAITLDNID